MPALIPVLGVDGGAGSGRRAGRRCVVHATPAHRHSLLPLRPGGPGVTAHQPKTALQEVRLHHR